MIDGVVHVNFQMISDFASDKKMKDVWRTVFALIANIEMHNIVKTSVAEIAEQLDVKASEVRSHIDALYNAGLLDFDEEGIYLNPHFVWKGSPESHQAAMRVAVKPTFLTA